MLKMSPNERLHLLNMAERRYQGGIGAIKEELHLFIHLEMNFFVLFIDFFFDFLITLQIN